MPCDYSKYPKDWRKIRASVLARADDKCEICGVENYAMVERQPDGTWYVYEGMELEAAVIDEIRMTRIILTVAHLNHDITDNRMENLKAMCQLHHNRHDAKHRGANRKETLKSKRQSPLF